MMILNQDNTMIVTVLLSIILVLVLALMFFIRKLNVISSHHQSCQYEKVIDNLHEALICTDLDGFITTWNQGAQLLLGFNAKEILGLHIRYIYPDKSHGFLDFKLIPSLKQKGYLSTEVQLVKKNLESIYVHLSLSMLYDSNNNQIGIIGNFFDISDQIVKRLALQKSEESYKNLFENSSEPNLIIEGKLFVSCNAAALEILGFKNKEELYEIHPSALSPITQPDGRDSLTKANEMISLAFLTGSHRFEWEHQRKNKQCFPVEVVLTTIRDHDKNILHVVWHDIKAKKQTETALAESEAKYKTLFVKSSDAMLIMDNGQLIECNNATVDLFAYPNKNELLASTLLDLSTTQQVNGVDSKHKMQQYIKTIYSQGSHKFIWHHKKYNGDVFPVEISCTLIPFNGKKVIHGILRNITPKEIFYDIINILNQQNFYQSQPEFLQESLISLAHLYKCKYTFVGLLKPDAITIDTMLVLVDSKVIDNFEYCLKDTPCQDVIGNVHELITNNVQDHYPNDKLLIEMNIESYFGAPLIAKDQTKIGIVVVMDTKPLVLNEWTESVLGIFAKQISSKFELTQELQELENYRIKEANDSRK